MKLNVLHRLLRREMYRAQGDFREQIVMSLYDEGSHHLFHQWNIYHTQDHYIYLFSYDMVYILVRVIVTQQKLQSILRGVLHLLFYCIVS